MQVIDVKREFIATYCWVSIFRPYADDGPLPAHDFQKRMDLRDSAISRSDSPPLIP